MTKPKYVNTLGFSVFSDDLDLIPINNESACVINTISPNSYGISVKDEVFKKALLASDYLVLDGVYFALASILLNGKNIKKNQGPDVFFHFINRAERNKKKVFFLGSTPKTLERIKSKLASDYPHVDARFYSPPFKTDFSDDENKEMINIINEYQPDIIFVGMTCPKQEKWSIKHRELLNTGLIICIGNVFDWFAGTQKAVSKIWYKLRLAWLIRIFLRPEIFKRNIGNQMRFFIEVILLTLRLRKIENA